MSTGAPLNLPKPKATTNTGQDMIELGNSLQKINDAVGGISDRLVEFRRIARTSGTTLSATLPSAGLYLVVVGGASSSATSAMYILTYSPQGVINTLTVIGPSNDSHTITSSGAGWELTSLYSVYAVIYRLG